MPIEKNLKGINIALSNASQLILVLQDALLAIWNESLEYDFPQAQHFVSLPINSKGKSDWKWFPFK